MFYKMFNETGNYKNQKREFVNLLEATEVYSPNGWQADGWIMFGSLDEAIEYYKIQRITEE